ncbi:hypothetical protein [Nonomuraea candida]|uniref:hypothetical protein n=1 Tax=Nonomuraea candida TaxID=359159 RepID=UPI000A6423D7|nr:hypothetical protein [Nonomuraea candida]
MHGALAVRLRRAHRPRAFELSQAVQRLTSVLDLAVAGDDEPVPTLERQWVRDALADPDPLGQLRRPPPPAARRPPPPVRPTSGSG